jgi:hypothetical protein
MCRRDGIARRLPWVGYKADIVAVQVTLACCADRLIAKQALFCSATMHTVEDPLPVFPPELEREIFETTAERHPKAIASLLLVSQRVNEW